ncbi:MAG: hypothetical protein ACRD2X_16410 [Vicinamibacteraceae bacterium]
MNDHFKAVVPDLQFLSGAETEQLIVLWQLRHSIVHTGNWLTHADAQKVGTLAKLADRPILLSDTFVEAVARRLHGIVGRTTKALEARVLGKALGLQGDERKALESLFEVESPRVSWLTTKPERDRSCPDISRWSVHDVEQLNPVRE